jgi:hypothetical protein
VDRTLGAPADEDAVWAVVTAQAAELSPPPVEILTLADRARSRWLPRWADELCFAFEPAHAGALIDRIADRHQVPGELLTDVLLGLAGMLAWGALQPAPLGLPTMPAFRAEEATRLFALLRPRLAPPG